MLSVLTITNLEGWFSLNCEKNVLYAAIQNNYETRPAPIAKHDKYNKTGPLSIPLIASRHTL